MQTVWITRHGERIDFVDKTWSETSPTPYDPHLSDNGHIQARDLAARLKAESVHHIFSSPFLRTLQTANAVAELLDLSIKVELGCGEMLSAEWFPADPRELDLHRLKERFPRIDTTYQSAGDPQYPEDWEQCKVRCAAAIRKVVQRYDENLFFVGHGASVSSLCWGLVDGYPQLSGKMCGLVQCVREGERWNLELAGDNSFLSYKEPDVRFH